MKMDSRMGTPRHYLLAFTLFWLFVVACTAESTPTASPARTTITVPPAATAIAPLPTSTVIPTVASTPNATAAPTPVPQSEAGLSASTSVGEAPLEVAFTNRSKNADAFEWDFGDDTSATSTSIDELVTHEYTKAGTYQVTLKATRK